MSVQTQDTDSFAATRARSDALEARIRTEPGAYRVLTGERPTGQLHVGHFFGSLESRLRLQALGVELFIVIADYQALTDREASERIEDSVLDCVLDYLAIGLDPGNGRTHVFVHSRVPSLNQLMLPLLSLVSVAELSRNPTVKDEIAQLGKRAVSAMMFTYPVHQAADILALHGNLVPGGRDQMPHVELARVLARRFNEHYTEYFEPPSLLLGEAPLVLGLDGKKMGKSRANSLPLALSEDDTVARIRQAKTDAERRITYEPERRPEVSNLVRLAALCRGQAPHEVAATIGEGGAHKLKQFLAEAINERFRAARARRKALSADLTHVRTLLREGNERAERVAAATLDEVRSRMHMAY